MAEKRAAGPAAALIIQLFGPPEVRRGDDPLPRLRSRKGQWLLALLTLRHGCPVERAWLAGTLWPDSPERQAFYNLRRCLTDLRHALGPEADRLRSPTPHTLRLDLCGATADVVVFDDAIARGDTPSLVQAVSLYRGPLLEGCEEEWAFEERRVRAEAFLTALETLAAGASAAGDPAVAVGYLRRAVAVDPLAEEAQRALMQALAASGRGAAATEAYRDFRLRLHRELNAQPAPETAALHQQLRAATRAKSGVGSRVSGVGSDLPFPDTRHPTPDTLPAGTVTFLFTDIEGSTRLWEEHPEAMREALARHDGLLHDAIAAHGGVVFKSMGDQICAAFATAADALGAALAAQHALQAEPWPLPAPLRGEGAPPPAVGGGPGEVPPLRVRMALHTGAAEARQGDYFGPTLSRVARLLEAGHGGQVLLSQPTYDLCRDHLPEGAELRSLGEHRLRDLSRPERIFQPVTPDLPADFPPLKTLDARPHNLPAQPTPLLGREQELAVVGERLRSPEVRLLTLTGPGGTGKTRLGLQVAAELLDAFESGVFSVALAPISDPDLVVSAIAQALGVRETAGQPLLESVRQSLQDKQLLLLLDNFEHLLAAAPLVAELLAGCPWLKVLVTSRAPLHLRGEQELCVPPLSLPDPRHLPPLEQLSQYAAVALFIQQAQAVKPEFAVTHESAPAVAEICHRLDGLPLAIELAAARVKLFPPQALLARMASRLKLLTGGAQDLPARQQTLRGAIAWSYDLLGEDEKRLFRRLSAFAGGFAVEAVEAVCSVEGDLGVDALDGVESLLNKSLLQPQEERSGDEPRFRMLETIREYAQERLGESREAEAIRRQHAAFFLALAESNVGFDRLEEEHDNLRAALAWSLEDAEGGETLLRLAGSLGVFWSHRGYWSEGRSWLERALALPGTPSQRVDGSPGPTRARLRALFAAGSLASNQDDKTSQRAWAEEQLAIARELGDKGAIAWSLHSLSWAALGQEDIASVCALGAECVAIYHELGDRTALVWSNFPLGVAACYRGDFAAARSLFEESLVIAHEAGDPALISPALAHLGMVAQEQGDWEAARALYEERLAIEREGDSLWSMARALRCVGEVAYRQGEDARARALLEESLALAREMGNRRGSADALHALGMMARSQGDPEAARALLVESLTIRRELGEKRRSVESLEGLAGLATAQGHAERAARLFGAAAALREAIGAPRSPAAAPGCERDVATARAALGEEAFAAAWAVGQTMTLGEAVAYALEQEGQGGSPDQS